jgi:hypothetical protein
MYKHMIMKYDGKFDTSSCGSNAIDYVINSQSFGNCNSISIKHDLSKILSIIGLGIDI